MLVSGIEKIWMCGGSIELIPCSRVGHVFRRRRPYGNEHHQVDTTLKNSLRVAHVWMDEYKKYFIRDLPKISNVDYGDVSDRISLRNKLKCHDFSWYLDNVYPELTLPDDTEGRLKEKWAKIEQKQMQPWHSRKLNNNDTKGKLSHLSRMKNVSTTYQPVAIFHQVGAGALIHQVHLNQRGQGIGGFLGGLCRGIIPLIGSPLKPVGKELLSVGMNVLGDVITRQSNLRDSIDNHLTQSGNKFKRKAMDKLDTFLSEGGVGYKKYVTRSNITAKINYSLVIGHLRSPAHDDKVVALLSILVHIFLAERSRKRTIANREPGTSTASIAS
ncbi:hypothetical protein HCN44_004824 [Aphidius gifuensis]|uniref:Uncharacterized protein n=1 Tax=Aphidius gifuensis TaxID=684658 RepID=A0A835CTM0_APHGI|nr:hypothetical protein HCN44_004824 [Aphidius gifuensis]